MLSGDLGFYLGVGAVADRSFLMADVCVWRRLVLPLFCRVLLFRRLCRCTNKYFIFGVRIYSAHIEGGT